MKKLAILALALLLAANVSAASKPRITGGNLPPIPSKPRITGGNLPPILADYICVPSAPRAIRRYCQPR